MNRKSTSQPEAKEVVDSLGKLAENEVPKALADSARIHAFVARHRAGLAVALGLSVALSACGVTSGDTDLFGGAVNADDAGVDGDANFDADGDAGDAGDAHADAKDAAMDVKVSDAKMDAPKDGMTKDANNNDADAAEDNCAQELVIWTDGTQNSFKQGTSIGLELQLAGIGGPSAVTARIVNKDSMGETTFLKTFYDNTALAPKIYKLSWDGKNMENKLMPPGDYTFSVLSTNSACTVGDERTVTLLSP